MNEERKSFRQASRPRRIGGTHRSDSDFLPIWLIDIGTGAQTVSRDNSSVGGIRMTAWQLAKKRRSSFNSD